MFRQFYPHVIEFIGARNPQLFREVKGKLKPKNVVIVSLASIIGQVLLYLYLNNLLPTLEHRYSNRYCTSTPADSYSNLGVCQEDLLGNIMALKELWWLDLFTTMSIMGIFILLVVGSYMLITDISKENTRNTLNFLRLTPQSAMTIMGGKMLGVPILVYLFGALALPLHFFAGLKANIPPVLIFGFYLVLGASCLFFYTASLLFSLISNGLGGFQAWLGSLAIFFFCLTNMGVSLEAYRWSATSFDWFALFYPGMFLAYLVKATFLSPNTIGYLSIEGLSNLNWYGNFWWQNSWTGFALIIANYGVWTFWLWQGVKRRFHNPHEVAISKYHSYLISACFIVFNLGFTLQENSLSGSDFKDKLIVFLIINFFYLLLITLALTPQRQTLLDWSRFRYENSNHRHLVKDLLLGEKSPAIGAIALNILLMNLYVTPAIVIFSWGEDKVLMLTGLILGALMMVIYATIYQLLLLLKTRKRNLIATSVVSFLIIAPLWSFIITSGSGLANFWLFSPFPAVAVGEVSFLPLLGSFLTQIAIIIGFNYQLKKMLNKAGESETKALLS
ncbi:ABC transporter permease [Cyanobacterium aponinum FACHB-4101]|uniref:ABC transporter permease n=1 Tax=Cyanobacterium aponinum TaxID=379064 RepID=UPI001680FF63|nr:ABC transporter permease [Cyanobacterium aponinum]MBD2393303.1 ABC transporter permease [Cyanobacterium aponinum FACHB-4101]